MAGALGVRLGGRRSYDGVPRDMPWLGRELAPPNRHIARRSVRLMWAVSVLAAVAAVAARWILLEALSS